MSMYESKFWYIFFVKTGQEKRIVELNKKFWEDEKCEIFIPKQEIVFISEGKVKLESIPLFPGYIFINTPYSDNQFLKYAYAFVKQNRDVISLLKYSENRASLKKEDKQLLIQLFDSNNCIKMSKGRQIGDALLITEGPLKGMESVIIKVNRHKRQASIKMNLLGEEHDVKLALEIYQKV